MKDQRIWITHHGSSQEENSKRGPRLASKSLLPAIPPPQVNSLSFHTDIPHSSGQPVSTAQTIPVSPPARPSLALNLRIQGLAAFGVTLPIWWLASHWNWPLGLVTVAVIQGSVAGGLAWYFAVPLWWRLIHALFPIAVATALIFPLPSWIWPLALVLLWLTNRNAVMDRVPLYLSGEGVVQVLGSVLPTNPFRFIDLGCGPGGLLAALAASYPQGYWDGVESAPLSFALAWLRLHRRPHCRVAFGDLWDVSLSNYDVVYCFLSPAPMTILWAKACAEMPPGSLFISNTFPVSIAPPAHQVIVVPGGTGPLYLWHMPP